MLLKPFANFWIVLIFLGAVQAFFLAFSCLAMAYRDQLAPKLLGWLLLSVGLTVVEVLLCYSNYIVYVPFLVGFSEPFNFVFPPLLYFYTLRLANAHFQWKASYNWAFLPAVLLAIYMIPFFAQSNPWLLHTVAVAYNRPSPIGAAFRDYAWAASYTTFYRVFKYLLVGYQIGYLVTTLWVIHKHKLMGQAASLSLRWVRQICWSFMVVFLIYALLTGYYQSDVGDVYVATCVSLVCFGMSFRLITQSKLLNDQPVAADFVRPTPIKYEKTALDETTSRQILERLLHYVEQEKPYQHNDLTLAALAAQLTTAPHHLSQVINQHCGQNFFDFINAYRVEEIQQKLVSPHYNHLKIETIAFESGFNSKSAFNAAFKKMTHQTPSQYRKTRATALS